LTLARPLRASEAITAIFPQVLIKTCLVHLIRRSLAFIS
jgi:transposase-like protein